MWSCLWLWLLLLLLVLLLLLLLMLLLVLVQVLVLVKSNPCSLACVVGGDGGCLCVIGAGNVV